VILGAGALATRGKKQMVRMADTGEPPATDDHWRPSAEAQALIERERGVMIDRLGWAAVGLFVAFKIAVLGTFAFEQVTGHTPVVIAGYLSP
jgi:hypothetical protein